MTIFLAFLLSFFACDLHQTSKSSDLKAAVDTIPVQIIDTIVEETQKTYTVIGVGDMMLGTNYPSAKYLPPKGGATMLAEVEGILQDADVTFGNLEGTILDEGGTAKRCNNPDACYVFRSPESYGRHFEVAGFDLLSIANNHSGDFGEAGRKKTKAVLDKHGIKYAGLAGTDEMTVFEKDGVRYGFCAFAPNRGTCDIRNLSYAKGIVEKLKARSDIIIVSFHGGAEGTSNQNVPRKSETYYGENRGDVYAFAHAVIDAGADIVFGHGPHVTRAMELYNDRIIAYSLGNFCTYGRFNLRGAAGFAPVLKVWVDKEGRFEKGEVIPVYQQYNHGPMVDPQKRAINKLIELTRQDFPETKLSISPDGMLTYK